MLFVEMFSTRVSAVGLARGLQVTIPHTAPVDGVTPYLAEKQYLKKPAQRYARTPAVIRSVLSSSAGLAATVNAFGELQAVTGLSFMMSVI